MEELMKRLGALLDASIEEQEPDRMRMVRHLFEETFHQLAKLDMQLAFDLIDRFEGSMQYNNYATQEEAESVTDGMENQDGTRGPKFADAQELFDALEDMEIAVDNAPYYNRWALYIVANMYASDHGELIRKLADGDDDKFLRICCMFASSQLMDKDKPYWVRWYFNLD